MIYNHITKIKTLCLLYGNLGFGNIDSILVLDKSNNVSWFYPQLFLNLFGNCYLSFTGYLCSSQNFTHLQSPLYYFGRKDLNILPSDISISKKSLLNSKKSRR